MKNKVRLSVYFPKPNHWYPHTYVNWVEAKLKQMGFLNIDVGSGVAVVEEGVVVEANVEISSDGEIYLKCDCGQEFAIFLECMPEGQTFVYCPRCRKKLPIAGCG